MKLNKYVPTGYPNIDVLTGFNKRDLNGELVGIKRGIPIGTQNGICAAPGVGKTALATEIAVAGKLQGYPLWKCVIIDADGNPTDETRLTKLTNLTEEEREGWFEYKNLTFVEDIASYLQALDKEYKSQKFKPVQVTDTITGEKTYMNPYVVLIFDTVTSIKSNKYSLGGETKADAIANQQGMTEGRLKGDLCNSIINICDGNIIVFWLAHLKKNTPEMGKQVAKKAYKAAPIDITDGMPERFRQKLSTVFWLNKVEDGNNQESSQHPQHIYGYGINSEPGRIYQANMIAVKSRASTENRRAIKMVFENGKFNSMSSLLGTILNIPDAIVKAGGMYPSAAEPSVFKDSEFKVPKRDAYKFKNENVLYNKPFNIIEARLLVTYNGDDEEILQAKAEMVTSLMQVLEDSFKYELECNNITQEQIDKNRSAFKSIYGFISQVKRAKVISQEELKVITTSEEDSNVEITSDDDYDLI